MRIREDTSLKPAINSLYYSSNYLLVLLRLFYCFEYIQQSTTYNNTTTYKVIHGEKKLNVLLWLLLNQQNYILSCNIVEIIKDTYGMSYVCRDWTLQTFSYFRYKIYWTLLINPYIKSRNISQYNVSLAYPRKNKIINVFLVKSSSKEILLNLYKKRKQEKQSRSFKGTCTDYYIKGQK